MDLKEKMLDNIIKHNKSKSKNNLNIKSNRNRVKGGSTISNLATNEQEETQLPEVNEKNIKRLSTYKVGDVVELYMKSNQNKFNELIKKKSMHKKNTLTINTKPGEYTSRYFNNNNSNNFNTQPRRGLSTQVGPELNNYKNLKTSNGTHYNETPTSFNFDSRTMTLQNEIPGIMNNLMKDKKIINIVNNVNNTNNKDGNKIDLKMNINKYDIKYYVGANEIQTNSAKMSDMSINIDIDENRKKDKENPKITELPKKIQINKATYKESKKNDLLLTQNIKDVKEKLGKGKKKRFLKMKTYKENKSKTDLPKITLQKALSLNLKRGIKFMNKLNTIINDNKKDDSLNEGKKFSEMKFYCKDLNSPVSQENIAGKGSESKKERNPYDEGNDKIERASIRRGTFLSSDSMYLGKDKQVNKEKNFEQIEKEFDDNENEQTSSNASIQSITYSYNKTEDNMTEDGKQELLINSDIKEIFPQVGKKEIIGSQNEKFTPEESPIYAKKKFQSELKITRGFNRKTTIENRPQIFTPEIRKEILRRHSILNPNVFNLFSENKSKDDRRHTLFPTYDYDEIILNESLGGVGFSEQDISGDEKISAVHNKNEDEEIKIIQTETNKIKRKKDLMRKSLLLIQNIIDDKFNESDKLIKRKKLINFYKNGFYHHHFIDMLNEDNLKQNETTVKFKKKNFDIDIKLAPYINEKYLSVYNEMIFQILNQKTFNEGSFNSLVENFSLSKTSSKNKNSFFNLKRSKNFDFDIDNHLFINGFIMRDCKGSFNNLIPKKSENTYRKYFNQKTGVRLLHELEELRKFSIVDPNPQRRSIRKKNKKEGYESETIDNEESLKANEGDNTIRLNKKRRTEEDKKRKFKLEMGKISTKLQEFTVLKSAEFFERKHKDKVTCLSIKRKSQAHEEKGKVFTTRSLPISKENTALRTHEIKTKSISISTCSSFDKLAFYIKDGDFENFSADFGKCKVPINTMDKDNNSLLNLAVQCGSIKIVQMLLERGADPNLQNKTLNAPLHYALSHHNFNIANLLLKYGANEELPNKHGHTPWQCVNNIKNS